MYAQREGAFSSVELEINPETVGRSSPYHTMSGVHWVRACVAQAMNDVVGFNQACDDLVRASHDLATNPDLTLGRAGTLVAFSSLIDLGRSVPLVDLSFVQAAGDQLAASLTAHLESLAPIAEEPTLRFLGIAHGWSGIVYALLRWREATGFRTGAGLLTRLDQLASAAEPTADGLRWPRLRRDSRSPSGDFVRVGATALAGFVHLWLIARARARGRGLSGNSRTAQRDALRPHGKRRRPLLRTLWSCLCPLCMFIVRVGTSSGWGAARKLAFRALRPRMLDAPFALSLYKGAVGPVVLAQELREPVTASMPLFESENWPGAEAV